MNLIQRGSNEVYRINIRKLIFYTALSNKNIIKNLTYSYYLFNFRSHPRQVMSKLQQASGHMAPGRMSSVPSNLFYAGNQVSTSNQI